MQQKVLLYSSQRALWHQGTPPLHYLSGCSKTQINHIYYTGMASKTPVSGVPSNGFSHQAPKVIASHEMSIQFVINYYSCFKTDLRSSGNIQAVLKTSVKREIIWKHWKSFEIVRKFWDHLEIFGLFWKHLEGLRSSGIIRAVLKSSRKQEVNIRIVLK